MQTAKGLTETRGAFVKNQDNATICSELANFVQKVIFRPFVTHHLHFDDTNVLRVHQCLKLCVVVVVEGEDRTAQALRHAFGVEARQQMAGQVFTITQVGGQIPVVPAVIAANSNFVFT